MHTLILLGLIALMTVTASAALDGAPVENRATFLAYVAAVSLLTLSIVTFG